MPIQHKKPLLFDMNEKDFDSQGYGIINYIVEGVITDEDGKDPYVELIVSERCTVFDKLVKMNIILADGQLYRIWDVEYNSENKEKEIYAKHITADCNCEGLYNRQYYGTLQGIVRTILLSTTEFPYTYKFKWNMGKYENEKMEFKIDTGYTMDEIYKVIQQFEEAHYGTKIEIERDNYTFGIHLFEESMVAKRSSEEIATVYNCNYLNIRAGRSTKYKVLTSVKANEDVVVLDKSHKWYKVRTSKDVIGYCNSGYLTNLRQGSESDVINKPIVETYGLGRDTGIRFDTNKIKNVKIQDDLDEFCTRVLAVGKDNINKHYVCEGGRQGYPFYITKVVNFDEADNMTNLEIYAKRYLQVKSMNIKNVTVELNQIFGTDLYQNLMFYKNLRLYDWIWVKHPSLSNHYERFKICKTVKNIEDGKLLEVELGQLIPSFSKKLKEQMDKSFLTNIADYATNQIKWSNPSLFVITSGSSGFQTIKTFEFSSTPASTNFNLQINTHIYNQYETDDIEFVVYLDGKLISRAQYIQRVFQGSNIINCTIPIPVEKGNAGRKHTLELKASGRYRAYNVNKDEFTAILSGNGLRTSMQYVEIIDK